MKKLYKNLFLVILVLCFTDLASAQGLSIGSGTTLSLGSSTLSITGNWENAGTFTAESGTIVFNNASGNQTITNSSGETFYNLTINKAANDVQLVNNITVTGTLTCTSGGLDLNGNVLALTGSLSETEGNTVKGSSGYITCSSDLDAPVSANPHSIGIEITSSANLGATTIIRGHEPQNSSDNYGIKRYFEITPANNSSLNATLVFNYDDSELNSIDESTFEMFNSEDHGNTWKGCTGTLDATSNIYTVSGINSFSRFTLASSSAPLPVELTSFTASVVDNTVVLNWQTTTEVNNYGFEIQRRVSSNEYGDVGTENFPSEWNAIAFVEGSGNSNSPKNYEYIDNLSLDLNLDLSLNGLEYRLKQIDTDGSFKYYSQTAKVDVNITDVNNEYELPTKFSLKQNYPNPFNPTTIINYSIPNIGDANFASPTNVTLLVFDMLGRKVATLVNKEQSAGNYSVNFDASKLTSGIYIYRITAGDFIQSRKMLLMK